MAQGDDVKVIYEPKGKAGEYGELAINLYNGCSHGCVYCYAPNVVHKSRDEFFNNPQPRKDIVSKLEDDVREMVRNGDKREVFLCFTCDPFQPLERIHHVTRNAIRIFQFNNIPFRILTKAGYKEIDDFFERVVTEKQLCAIGSTLVFAKDRHSKMFEPNAPVTSERIKMLWDCHVLGFKTWVSLEPVWTPEDAFAIIKLTHDFVDEYKIGKLNYHPQSKNVDWKRFAIDVSKLCEDLGCKYTLKEDLARLVTT